MIRKTLFILICQLIAFHYCNAQWFYNGPSCFATSLSVASNSLIAIDNAGKPYVAYKDQLNGNKISVMAFDGTNWNVVGNTGFSNVASQPTSLTFDPSGTPYVSYVDATNKVDVVMKFNGTSWVSLGSPITSNLYSTLMDNLVSIDATGTPYIFNINNTTIYTTYHPTCFKYSGGVWSQLGDTLTGNNCQLLAFKISSTGIPYCMYRGTYSGVTTYFVKRFSAGVWNTVNTTTNLYPSGVSAGVPKCAFSSSGTPYVLYADNNNSNKLSLLQFNGTSWQLVGSAGFSASCTNYFLTIDNSGTPFVIADLAPSTIQVLKYSGGIWNNVGVNSFSQISPEGIAVSSSGTPYALLYQSYFCTGSGNQSVVSYDPTRTDIPIPLEISDDINLFPNPNNGDFNISAPNKKLNISISELNGRILFETSIDANTSKLSVNLANGFYILHAYNNTINNFKKLIIEK